MTKNTDQGLFGQLLKAWRAKRSLSQLGLATTTGTTTRHLSFLENGRSQPTSDMILRLSEALDIPFRERNSLFRAAGLREHYRERSLNHPEMESITHAIDIILNNHEPYPAFVLNRYWELLKVNKAGKFMLQSLVPAQNTIDFDNIQTPVNILLLMFQSTELRQRALNWDVLIRHVIQRIRRESFEDAESAALIEQLKDISDLPEDYWNLDLSQNIQPVIPMQLDTGHGTVLSLLSMITTFGTPADMTAQELRIELIFPADETTANALRQAANQALS